MMRSLIAVAALVASVSVSAGKLDGKGMACYKEDWPYPLMYEFRGGGAVLWRTYLEGTDAILKEHMNLVSDPQFAKYHESVAQIWWRGIIVVDEVTVRLDRKTLELTSETRQGEMESHGICEVYQSLDKFQALMEAERMDSQKRIDEQMKDNKI
jgi:hypothetical protein